MLDEEVGYIELTTVQRDGYGQPRAAIDRLQGQGMKSLVLDMRRNTGGLLDQGMSIADLFLDRRQLVLETRGRTADQNHVLRARSGDAYPGLELAVLIGQRSASATEIVAGALQDHDRAILIGETTFGKGSVQTLYQLPGNNMLKLTTARWYTPSGRSIQKPYGIDGHPSMVVDGQEMDAGRPRRPRGTWSRSWRKACPRTGRARAGRSWAAAGSRRTWWCWTR
jgi:carboxyl-terminal processing protease